MIKALKWHLFCPLTFHWLKVSHWTQPSCKVDWQINIHELHVPKKRKMDPGVQLAISTTLAKDQISVFDQWHQVKKDSKRLTEIFSCYPAIWHYASTENGHLPMLLRLKVPAFPGGAVVENLPANAGDTVSSPGLGRSHMPRSN